MEIIYIDCFNNVIPVMFTIFYIVIIIQRGGADYESQCHSNCRQTSGIGIFGLSFCLPKPFISSNWPVNQKGKSPAVSTSFLFEQSI